MPLLDLANELLLCIAENLESERDINAFTRTNRHLYYLLNVYLYRHNVRKSDSWALLWAATRGREAAAQKLIAEGANLKVMDLYKQKPALKIAAKKGHLAVVKLLLEAKEDVNVGDRKWRTALHAAAKNGDLAVLKLLLESKAEVDRKDKDGATALHLRPAKGK